MSCRGSEDISSDCFVHRVAALPLVSATAHQALVTYEKTKNYNSLLHATLTAFENGLFYAKGKVEPFVYPTVEAPLNSASKLACKGLNRLEERYPAIKITPEELKEVGYGYYNGSYVQKSVNTVLATKNYGDQKVAAARQSVKGAVTSGQKRAGNVVRYGFCMLNGTLDYCDDVIDRYVAEEEEENVVSRKKNKNKKNEHDYSTASYAHRVHCMGGKVAGGVRAKTRRQVEASRALMSDYLHNFQGALALTEYARSTADWAGKVAKENYEHVRSNASAVLRNLEAHAHKYNLQPEALLLRWIKLSAAALSAASNQMVKHTGGFLPETMRNSLEGTAAYLHELDETFADAESLKDVKKEVVSEAKDKMASVEKTLFGVLDQLSEWPPISWMNGKIQEAHDERVARTDPCKVSTQTSHTSHTSHSSHHTSHTNGFEDEEEDAEEMHE